MGVAQNYKMLLEEIREEAVRAHRDPESIKLLAISKTHPWEIVKSAYNIGCRDFGENRVQEALSKKQEAPEDVRWHFVGALQKNKVSKVIGQFALIHSVDSVDLVQKINELSKQAGIKTPILLQVNTSGESTKQGFTVEETLANFDKLKELPSLKIEGLMTMAPFTEDKAVRIHCFSALKELQNQLGVKELSMGMSHDWREAVHAGATILRIGSAIFGDR